MKGYSFGVIDYIAKGYVASSLVAGKSLAQYRDVYVTSLAETITLNAKPARPHW